MILRFTHLLLAPVLALGLLTSPAMAQKLSLDSLSAYFNGLVTAKSSFTQVNDDGTLSTGTLYIKRPGKIRFEYNPPEETLVLASANTVAIFDPKTNQGPQSYPLNKTPLSLILARKVDLGRARMVTDHSYDGTATLLTAQDPKHPEYGSIQLKFTSNPVELRQWVIRNESGSSTTVVLGPLTKGEAMPNTLFDIGLNTDQRDR
ncbi:outer membrane lipoprotein carrier protein LolA [uncultured Lentibacter sp.]|jgi:outer membrane lipoprotein-sorting protein|uniref:LolA family protein n=1 Tax=uncultured Lentibacter sp. TaxID=1659309 RepID=UPI00260DFAC8|nr:outer membrane lipoprotein carrier protein LolA [uncultured Lentibacter sp.]